MHDLTLLCCGVVCPQHHLAAHSRTHSGEKPFKCETCDYRAADRSNMLRHLRRHGNSARLSSLPAQRLRDADIMAEDEDDFDSGSEEDDDRPSPLSTDGSKRRSSRLAKRQGATNAEESVAGTAGAASAPNEGLPGDSMDEDWIPDPAQADDTRGPKRLRCVTAAEPQQPMAEEQKTEAPEQALIALSLSPPRQDSPPSTAEAAVTEAAAAAAVTEAAAAAAMAAAAAGVVPVAACNSSDGAVARKKRARQPQLAHTAHDLGLFYGEEKQPQAPQVHWSGYSAYLRLQHDLLLAQQQQQQQQQLQQQQLQQQQQQQQQRLLQQVPAPWQAPKGRSAFISMRHLAPLPSTAVCLAPYGAT
jgi:hypothetical protein